MKSIFSAFLMLGTTVVYAQSTKMISVETGSKYQKTKLEYSVLSDADTIKHGVYKRYWNGKLAEEGKYNMNQPDGVWKLHINRKIYSEKEYAAGVRTGVWKFYQHNGYSEWKYDFAKANAEGSIFFAELATYQNDNGEWISDTTQQHVIRLSGTNEWMAFLNTTLRYPEEAIPTRIQGKVVVEILMDENGYPVDYAIAESANSVLNAETLRIFKLYKPEILPVIKDGKKVKVKIRLPLIFRLG